jgi:hypothetical protein
MTAAGRINNAIPESIRDVNSWRPRANRSGKIPPPSLHILRLSISPGDTSCKKGRIVGYSLLRREDEEGDAAVNHLNASEH